jgi:hypothetical protein
LSVSEISCFGVVVISMSFRLRTFHDISNRSN